jgi:hypothetical protein
MHLLAMRDAEGVSTAEYGYPCVYPNFTIRWRAKASFEGAVVSLKAFGARPSRVSLFMYP